MMAYSSPSPLHLSVQASLCRSLGPRDLISLILHFCRVQICFKHSQEDEKARELEVKRLKSREEKEVF